MAHLPIRIGLVNDYPIVVAGLAAMLAPFSERVTVADTDTEDLPLHDRVDLVLVDTFGRHLERVRRSFAGRPWAVFVLRPSEQLMSATLREGARGVLDKSIPATALVEAIERMHAGEIVTYTASESRRHLSYEALRWPGQAAGLTIEESEILSLLVDGMNTAEIASTLWRSEDMTRAAVDHLYRTLGVHTRADAVLWAQENGAWA